MSILRARPFRSVHLVGDEGPTTLVKAFHHPHPVLALFDAARARREHRALVALEREGFPVPRSLGLARVKGAWELRLALVEQARPLEEHLAGAAPPRGWEALLGRLGALLARLQAAGWEHGDLHAGNVLVDAQGAPWLIDLAHARRSRPDRARCLAQLVECAAIARERLGPRLRTRFLCAWRARLPPALRPVLAGPALLAAVEDRARTRRRSQVRAGLGRWLRESSRVRTSEDGGLRRLERRDLAGDAPVAVRLAGPRAELEARWLGAARLLEHGLPAARPARLWIDRNGWARAEFEAPPRGAPDEAELRAALAERGLALASPRLAQGPGGLFLLPPREPEDFPEPDA